MHGAHPRFVEDDELVSFHVLAWHGRFILRWSDFHDPAWVFLVVTQQYEQRDMRMRFIMAIQNLCGQWKQRLCV